MINEKRRMIGVLPILSGITALILLCYGCQNTSADLLAKEKASSSTSVITSQSETTVRDAPEVIPASAASAWERKSDIPFDIEGFPVKLNEKIYIIHTDAAKNGCMVVAEYNTDTDKWVQKKGVSNTPNAGVFGVAAVNGKIYILGGWDPERKTPLDVIEEYNPEEDKWTIKGKMPMSIDCASACSYNNRIYIAGGADETDTTLGILFEYNPVNNTWNKKCEMPTPRRELGLVALGDKIYAVGGHNSGRAAGVVEKYDIKTDAWEKKCKLPIDWAPTPVIVLSGKIYTATKNLVFFYNETENRWIQEENSPNEAFSAILAEACDKMYILGGIKGIYPNFEKQRTVYECNPGKIAAQALDEVINEYVDNKTFSGSVLIAKKGEILLNKGYGMADYDKGIANTSDTRFFLASITKSFTSVAIMQLYEKGLIGLNDPITKFLPQCTKWKDITIEQLLYHTSGLVRYDELPYEVSDTVPDMKAIDRVKELPLLFSPGTRTSYSNLGYYLLGIIIEKASNKSYSQYMKDNIFVPLGMKDTGCAIDMTAQSMCAQPCSLKNGLMRNQELIHMYKLYSAGNIYSTVMDMYLYDRALYTEKLLRKSTLDMINKPMFNSESGREFIPCMGATNNIFCSFERYINDDTVIIILSNVEMMQCMPFKNDLTMRVFEN